MTKSSPPPPRSGPKMDTANSGVPKRPSSRFADMTISRKLVAIVILCVGFGFILMIGVQIAGTRADLHNLAYRHSLHLTELLSKSVAGGIRWQQPDAVERSYRSFLGWADTKLVGVVAMNQDGEVLSSYHDNEPIAAVLGAAVDDAQEELGWGGVYSSRDPHHVIVVTPVLIGRDNTQVGTLAVAWSLEDLNALIRSNLDRQGILAGFSLLALIILLLALLNYTVSYPMRAVSAATIQLAEGDRSVTIPESRRGDEIGEMARALDIFKHHILTIDQLTREQAAHARQLSEALDQERKYNALHREFVAMASHEFRTPLAIIDGAAQRILRRAERMAPDELQERVGKIRSAVTRMIGLIDSTLSASRMEAGQIELSLTACELPELLETVCRRQQEIAPEHQIALNVGKAPKQIVADPKQLDQIFTNLLSNAVKYSPSKGRIDVACWAEDGVAAISVRDPGVGIPEDELPKLFERFFRASTSTGIPGTGIGLNVVKQLIEMHGGSIAVASAKGMGSLFTVRLPLSATAEGSTPDGAAKRTVGAAPAVPLQQTRGS